MKFCTGFKLSCVSIKNICSEWRGLSLYMVEELDAVLKKNKKNRKAVGLSCPVKNVNKPDHSNPLKKQCPAMSGNDEIICSPD